MTPRVDRLLAELSVDDKAALTAGADFWSTTAIPTAGIPSVSVTDGPNGARGSALFGLGAESSVCVPCGSALGATWNPALLERVGAMLGEETRTKACRVLLAPTVNIHRSPVAGRNFECYSEDPLLAGKIAAAFIRGVQSQGVATTVKHYAGNEAEFERMSISSVIDERTLREIYLVPFELAVREGGSLGVMTAYNKVNGTHASEHAGLVTHILRGEWGFDGFVLTDWFSAGSTVGSAHAGVDLEMPGPGRSYGAALADAVRAGSVAEATLDAQVRHLLSVFERLGALDDPSGTSPTSHDRPEHRLLAREAATESIVLLKNDAVLPFAEPAISSLALIGPNAEWPQIMGGGSASLAPHYRVGLLEALRARFGDRVDVCHERGVAFGDAGARLAAPSVSAPDGAPGFAADLFAGTGFAGAPVHRTTFRDGRLLLITDAPGVPDGALSMRVRTRFMPAESGIHTFTMVEAGGHARLHVDGQVVIDGFADPPPPGTDLFGMGSEEVTVEIELTAGTPTDLLVEYEAAEPGFFRGAKLGCRRPNPPDLLDRAVAAAAAADAAVVVVGTDDEWESEGHDRPTMDLPGAQDDLVARIVAANPNTVVVVNSGSPVTMTWAREARAVMQVWFGGQEAGNAIADVLLGDADPGGRLPTTMPVRLEHNPSFGNFPGENGEVRYGEGLLVGYRWYEARHLPTCFPFGHGLSYTRFAVGAPELSSATIARDGSLAVRVPVTNTGERRGSEVVQCYVEPRAARVSRPLKELKAFAKVALEPGEQTVVALDLDARAFAYWDPAEHAWHVDAGEYDLHVGRSSENIAHVVRVTVTE